MPFPTSHLLPDVFLPKEVPLRHRDYVVVVVFVDTMGLHFSAPAFVPLMTSLGASADETGYLLSVRNVLMIRRLHCPKNQHAAERSACSS